MGFETTQKIINGDSRQMIELDYMGGDNLANENDLQKKLKECQK